MRRTRVILLTGPYGSGKTLMAVSYKPDGIDNPRRLIIDKEARALEYNSEFNGLDGDHPESLLYSYRFWPDEYGDFTLEQFAKFIAPGKFDYDVIILENMAVFQEDIAGWCQTADGAGKILKALGMEQQYKTFLQYRFNAADAAWISMCKAIVFKIIMVWKRAGCDVVITTELKNVWKNYGARGRDADGNPKQQILGQTAKAWDALFKVADVIWHLSRSRDRITAAPTVGIDPFTPKCSIVGVPPTFEFKGWDAIWEYTKSRIPTKDFSGVEVPAPEYIEPGAEESEVGDPMEAGKARLLEEVCPPYASRVEVGRALKALKLEYTLDQHEEIKAALLSAREASE